MTSSAKGKSPLHIETRRIQTSGAMTPQQILDLLAITHSDYSANYEALRGWQIAVAHPYQSCYIDCCEHRGEIRIVTDAEHTRS